MRPFDTQFMENLELLLAQVNRAETLLSCLKALLSSESEDQYPPERQVFESQRYNDFFGVISSSIRNMLVLQCYSLLDKRKDVNSISNITMPTDEAINIPDEIICIWEKVKKIRHKSVAHIDLNVSPKSLYADANLTYGELELFVQFAKNMTLNICKAHKLQIQSLRNTSDVTVATKNVLHDLFYVMNEKLQK